MRYAWLIRRRALIPAGRLALLAILVLVPPTTALGAEEASPQLSATLRQGLISVSARDTALRDILTELSRASGIHIYLESSVTADEPITIAFDGLAPEEGLRRLLRANNFILVYASGALAEVRVYTEGRGQFVRLPTAPEAGARATRARKAPVASAKAQPESATPAKPPVTDRSRPAVAGPDPELAQLRTQALTNPDPSERAAGLEELAGSDNHELALGTATRVLETERVSEVLQSALGVFASLDTVPLEPILAFIAGDRVEDAAVRIQALELLSEHGQNDPRVREVLTRLARSDKNGEVRKSAQDLLDDFGK